MTRAWLHESEDQEVGEVDNPVLVDSEAVLSSGQGHTTNSGAGLLARPHHHALTSVKLELELLLSERQVAERQFRARVHRVGKAVRRARRRVDGDWEENVARQALSLLNRLRAGSDIAGDVCRALDLLLNPPSVSPP